MHLNVENMACSGRTYTFQCVQGNMKSEARADEGSELVVVVVVVVVAVVVVLLLKLLNMPP